MDHVHGWALPDNSKAEALCAARRRARARTLGATNRSGAVGFRPWLDLLPQPSSTHLSRSLAGPKERIKYPAVHTGWIDACLTAGHLVETEPFFRHPCVAVVMVVRSPTGHNPPLPIHSEQSTPRKRLPNLTEEESWKVWEYVRAHGHKYSWKGNQLWAHMEADKILPDRLAQSLKSHFKKKILPELVRGVWGRR